VVFWVVGGKTVEGKGLGLPDELCADWLGAEIGDGSFVIELVPSSVGQPLNPSCCDDADCGGSFGGFTSVFNGAIDDPVVVLSGGWTVLPSRNAFEIEPALHLEYLIFWVMSGSGWLVSEYKTSRKHAAAKKR